MSTRAVILAAGRGSRMAGLTDDRPKCLVGCWGRSLLDWQMQALRAAGIDDIGIVRGYRAADLASYGLHTFDNPRWAETNMVVSLTAADAWLREGPCLVCYADLFYGPAVVRDLAASTASIAMAYDPGWLSIWQARFTDPLADAETFRLAADGSVAAIGQRTASLDDIEGQYMGLLRFDPQGWAVVRAFLDRHEPAWVERCDMTRLLSGLLADGVHIAAVANHQPWGEVDSADDLLAYNRLYPGGPVYA